MDRNFIRSSRFASFGGRSLFPGETSFPANAVCTAGKRTFSALFFLPPPNKRPGRSRDGFVSRRWGLACFDCSKDNIKPFGGTYCRFFLFLFFFLYCFRWEQGVVGSFISRFKAKQLDFLYLPDASRQRTLVFLRVSRGVIRRGSPKHSIKIKLFG